MTCKNCRYDCKQPDICIYYKDPINIGELVIVLLGCIVFAGFVIISMKMGMVWHNSLYRISHEVRLYWDILFCSQKHESGKTAHYTLIMAYCGLFALVCSIWTEKARTSYADTPLRTLPHQNNPYRIGLLLLRGYCFRGFSYPLLSQSLP